MDQPNPPVWRVAEVPTQFRLPGVEQPLALEEARYASTDGRLRYLVLPDGSIQLVENVVAPAADLLQEILQNFEEADPYHQYEQEAQGPHAGHPFQQGQLDGHPPYPLQQDPDANLGYPVQQAQGGNGEHPHEYVQQHNGQVGLDIAPPRYQEPVNYQGAGFVNDAADINLEYQQIHGAHGAHEEIEAFAPNGIAVFEVYEWREQDHDGDLEEGSDESTDDDGGDGEGDDEMEDEMYQGEVE